MTTTRSPGSWMVFAAALLAVVFTVSTDAHATTWEVAYVQDFQNGHPGWVLDRFTRTDEIDVVPELELHMDVPRAAVADNYVLAACSLDPAKGCGFRADSPTFDRMGVDTDEPYMIEFRYGLHRTPACYTYALASTHVSLVITECYAERGYAVLAFVDELAGTETKIGNITLGPDGTFAWNQIEVLVTPYDHRPGATVTVGLNGTWHGPYARSYESTFDDLVFQDLPFRAVDPVDMDTLPAVSAFGSGVWDNVRVLAPVSSGGGGGPRGIHPRVEPNPFNPQTEISFVLDREASVRIDLFDLRGRLVRRLFEGRLPAGPQAVKWDGHDDSRTNVASGPYLVRTVVDGETTVTRAMVVR